MLAAARRAAAAPSPARAARFSGAAKFPAVDPSVGAAPHVEARRAAPRASSRATVVGTVCYAESTASIWKGIMRHFGRRGLDTETVLFSSYERLNAALLAGAVHVAWGGPLAHARLTRLARSRGGIVALGMRDSDRDFTTHVVVRADAGIAAVRDLAHRRVAAGTVDSPQAYIMPLAALAAAGVPLASLSVTRFDRDVGKHGDTAHGETAVLEALRSGAAEAGFISALFVHYIAPVRRARSRGPSYPSPFPSPATPECGTAS